MRALHLFGNEVRVSAGWLLAAPTTIYLFGAVVFPRWQPDWGPVWPWFTALIMAAATAFSALLQALAGLLYARSDEIALERVMFSPRGGLAVAARSATRRDAVALALIGPGTSLFVGLFTYFLFLVTAGDLMGDILGAAVTRGDPAAVVDALEMLGPAGTILLWMAVSNVVFGLLALVPGFGTAGTQLVRRSFV